MRSAAPLRCVPPAAGRERGRFFSVIREITGQFDLFPKEEHDLPAEIQRERLERVANEISARSETVKDVPLDLFHPSEAALEKAMPFITKCFVPSVLPRTHGVITKVRPPL